MIRLVLAAVAVLVGACSTAGEAPLSGAPAPTPTRSHEKSAPSFERCFSPPDTGECSGDETALFCSAPRVPPYCEATAAPRQVGPQSWVICCEATP